jgi:hypothetical protein
MSTGSCLEGTPAISVDLILQAALFYHPGSRVKFRGKVNVTVHFGLAARERTKQRKGT